MLLISELFVFIHVIGFLVSIVKSKRTYKTVSDSYFAAYSAPSVTCFICTYNEPAELVEETVASVLNLDYRNKEVVLLDDSTGAFKTQLKELGKKYSIRVIHRDERSGFKAGAINNGLKYSKAKYIVVFDADQKPTSNFLKDLVYLLEQDEQLALVQTPQFYTNTRNLIAQAAWFRQSVFYEYVCEGKSTNNAMFCCGSNFILRRKAIDEIGGFDETTVTEDFATTLKLQKIGWKTLYYNVVYVSGLGPITLGAYFVQQYRWAHGTVTTFKEVVRSFIKNPFALKPAQWWEYILSSTYFFTGWSNFVFMTLPIAFLLFGIRPLIADPIAYLAAFVPYFVLTLLLFAYSMKERGYQIKDLFFGQAISLITFSVYMVADAAALLGIKTKFMTTPKEDTSVLSIVVLWPQLVMLALSILAVTIGIVRGIETGSFAVWINVFWAFYHAALLSYIFVFNKRKG